MRCPNCNEEIVEEESMTEFGMRNLLPFIMGGLFVGGFFSDQIFGIYMLLLITYFVYITACYISPKIPRTLLIYKGGEKE